MEQLNCYEIPSSGAVAAELNGSVLVCKPFIHYRTFVCTTELKRRAANYSETGVGDLRGRYCLSLMPMVQSILVLSVPLPAESNQPLGDPIKTDLYVLNVCNLNPSAGLFV